MKATAYVKTFADTYLMGDPFEVENDGVAVNEILIKMLRDPEGVQVEPGDAIHIDMVDD